MVTDTEVAIGMVTTMVITMAIMTACTMVGMVMAVTTVQAATILMVITIGIMIAIIDTGEIIETNITDREEASPQLSQKIVAQD